MKSIEFHRPVWVGDIVSFTTRVVRIGRTSLTMHVSVDTERDGAAVHLTDAEVTYVSVSGPPQDQRPVPIRGEATTLPRRTDAGQPSNVSPAIPGTPCTPDDSLIRVGCRRTPPRRQVGLSWQTRGKAERRVGRLGADFRPTEIFPFFLSGLLYAVHR